MTQISGSGPTPAPEKRSGGLTGRVVLNAAKRRPFSLLGVALLAACVGGAVWFLLPMPKATAATVLHISSHTPSILGATDSRADFVSYRASQIALVKRRLTLNKVLKEHAVSSLDVVAKQSDPLAWLEHALKVESPLNSEYMRVSLEGDNAQESKIILDHLNKAYLADVDDRDNGAKRDRLKKLEATNRIYRDEVKEAHKRIDTIALALGSKDEGTLLILDSFHKEELRFATRDLSTARDNRRIAEHEFNSASPPPAPETSQDNGRPAELTLPGEAGEDRKRPPELTLLETPEAHGTWALPPKAELEREIDAEVSQDAGLKMHEAAVAQAKATLDKLKERFRDGERLPAIIKAEEDWKTATQRLEKYRNELRSAIAPRVQRKYVQDKQIRLTGLRATVETMKKREEIAQEKVDAIRASITRANDYRVELENLKSSIKEKEKLIASLGETIERLKVELGAEVRVKVSEDPFIVSGLEGNRRLKYTVLAALAVLGIGFAGVIGWEARARRLTNTDDVTKALGVRLLGTVPAVGPQTGKTSSPAPSLVEAIDATRTMLVHGTDEPDLRVLVVTSAVSGEGKTSLTGHLAISLARAGFRTLLVDGDLRAPTVHRVFDAPLTPGLCEILRGTANVAEAVRPTGIPGLSAITAGEWTLATRHALVGDRWRATKDQFKAEFDFVIVDTSPLLLVSDTLLLAREADGVVVSVLMGVSQIALVDEAVARLQAVRAKVTGVIANGVRHAAHAYTHGYGTIDHDTHAPALPASPATTERK